MFEPPFERNAAAQPELIVTYSFEQARVLDLYREIAPTVQLKPGVELELLGQVFAAEEEAAALGDDHAAAGVMLTDRGMDHPRTTVSGSPSSSSTSSTR